MINLYGRISHDETEYDEIGIKNPLLLLHSQCGIVDVDYRLSSPDLTGSMYTTPFGWPITTWKIRWSY